MVRRSILGWRLLAAAFFVVGAAPLEAGQPTGGLDLTGAVPGLGAPAERGKPLLGRPPAALGLDSGSGCVPALPCDTRVLGSVRKNGAVELQVPAWRW